MATIEVKLNPWIAPNFALPEGEKEIRVAVSQLTDQALQELANKWVIDLYTKAGKNIPHPFFALTPTKEA